MDSDTRKLAAMMMFRDRGFDEAAAGRASLAMMPLDDGYQPDRDFEKATRKLAKQFAKSSKRSDAPETDRLAIETLSAIKALAVEHGEEYYATRYDKALERDA